MVKDMKVNCNFVEHNLTCVLPENTMDVLLKVQTRSGEHTFQEDVYTRTLKYRRWNNELRPFHSLKKRVANMFRKRNSFSDSSRGTSTQSIINNIEQCKVETRNKDSEMDGDRESIHSNWSEIPINNEVNKISDATQIKAQLRKGAIKNIVLVLYKPKPKDLGSWKIKSPYVTSIVDNPPLDPNQNQNQSQDNEEISYVPHSPYYAPAHPPEFYEDE